MEFYALMNRFRLVALICMLTAHLLPICGQESVYVGVTLDTYFDNREYSQSSDACEGSFNSDSGTFFSSKLLPTVHYQWARVNSLVVGCELIENFGEVDSKFLASTLPVVYYKYESPSVVAASGIFPRDLMHIEGYSRAIFSSDYIFYNNLMSGFMGSYSKGKSYVELALDWEGMRSELSREKFRLLSSGRHYLGGFYYGYNASLYHFAVQDDGVNSNIVDYSVVNPAVGYGYRGVVDFSAKAGVIFTAQRDRHVSIDWQTPTMGELSLEFGYKGLSIVNELYIGSNINPYFYDNGYELYPNEPFFRGEGGVYNCTSFRYSNSFFKDTLSVNAQVALHYDGCAVATQYIVDVGIKILKRVYQSN